MNELGIGNELVVDTSVVLKFYVPESDSDRSDALLEQARRRNLRLLAVDLLLAEFLNVLWVKCRRGELSAVEAEDKIADLLLLAHGMQLVPLRILSLEALRWARRLGHAAYDAAFLALAESRDVSLVTADEKFYRTARRHTSRVILLRHLAFPPSA